MGKMPVSASWQKRFSDHLAAHPFFEEGEGPEDFLLIAAELLWGQVQIEGAGVEEGLTGTLFTREVWGRGEFWPCLLFR